MSHTTTLKSVAIQDVDAVRAAVRELKESGINIELRTNMKPRMYYSNQHDECEYVLHLPDCPYDIGLDRQDDGSYLPVFDLWAGYVSDQIGASCPVPSSKEGKAQHAMGQFLQSYAKNAAINAAVSQGYHVGDCHVDDAGNVQLTVNV